MRRYIYFILIVALFSCHANDKQGQNAEEVNKNTTGKIYLGYDAIRKTLLPPLFVVITNKE